MHLLNPWAILDLYQSSIIQLMFNANGVRIENFCAHLDCSMLHLFIWYYIQKARVKQGLEAFELIGVVLFIKDGRGRFL